jgi:hypothetical protein
MALVFPTPAQAALQTPLNTFSPTSSPLPNLTNGFTYVYDSGLGVWTAAVGSAGTVLNPATFAEAAAGTLTTVYSSPATAVPKDAAGMAGAALLPGSGAAYGGSPVTGMIRYNNSTPPAVIEYYNGGAWVTLGSGGATAATLAEAAAGTINTKFLSPETGVPKDAAGMTGAALIPGGNDGARPVSPVTGMTRYNDQGGVPALLEYYDGANWTQFPTPLGGNVSAYISFNAVTMVDYSSANVSSNTRTATGRFTTNFTLTGNLGDYATVMSTSFSTFPAVGGLTGITTKGATSLVWYTCNSSNTATNFPYCTLLVVSPPT